MRKRPPHSGIVGTVQDSCEGGICEGFPSHFCVHVGFLGADSEAGIAPENPGIEK
jgi:hypothetical protein